MTSTNAVESRLAGSNILDSRYWDQRRKKYKIRTIDTKSYNFFGQPLVDRLRPYLKPDETKRVLEIGCVPCESLCVVAKEFQYQVYGIDFTSRIDIAEDFLAINGVRNYTLFSKDFMTWETADRFDLILSLGFIEHFKNYEFVIEKHIGLLADSGYLVLGFPNFRYGQFILRCLIDMEHVRRHNLDCMDLKKIRTIFDRHGMRIHELGYIGGTFNIGTIGFDKDARRNSVQKVVLDITRRMGWRMESFVKRRKIHIPNKYCSPYIFCITQK